MIPPDRVYLDPGDRLAGRFEPPVKGSPRNVLVKYLDDGSRVVIPFTRRLRRAPGGTP